MNFVIYTFINGVYNKIAEIKKDTKSIREIVATIKNNGYAIGGISFKYLMEFDDVLSFDGVIKNTKRCLVITPV